VLGWLRAQPFNQRTEDALANHPLVVAAEAGTMPLEVARLVLLEEFSIETNDLRSMALALARHGEAPAAAAFFQSSVNSESIAREKLVQTAHALGVSPATLEAYEPMTTAHAYTAYLAELSSYGGMASVAAGFAVNFPAYGRMCGRVGRALVAHYNLTEADVGFFSWFAAPVPSFDDSATAVISEGMRRGETPDEIRRGGRLLQGYELMFWDSVWARGTGATKLAVPLLQ
jgi:pyrroloquinoline quinone (PQQ) biosynthesis protein C